MASGRLQRTSMPVALNFCLLNWLIPGAGYVAAGDVKRGAALFAIIMFIFVTGIGWGGYVMRPPFAMSDPDFNLVAALTYIVQALFGGGWLAMQALHSMGMANPEAFFNMVRLAAQPYSDLGVFHLVVAGGLNYHATVRLYDLMAGNPELTQSIEEPAAGETTAASTVAEAWAEGSG